MRLRAFGCRGHIWKTFPGPRTSTKRICGDLFRIAIQYRLRLHCTPSPHAYARGRYAAQTSSLDVYRSLLYPGGRPDRSPSPLAALAASNVGMVFRAAPLPDSSTATNRAIDADVRDRNPESSLSSDGTCRARWRFDFARARNLLLRCDGGPARMVRAPVRRRLLPSRRNSDCLSLGARSVRAHLRGTAITTGPRDVAGHPNCCDTASQRTARPITPQFGYCAYGL
jgi:hypothetical protein